MDDEALFALRQLNAAKSLEPGECLNDDAVELALSQVARQNTDLGFVDSLIMKSFVERRPTSLNRLRARVTGKAMLLIPVCHDEHWSLYAYEVAWKILRYYDSMRRSAPAAVEGAAFRLLAALFESDSLRDEIAIINTPEVCVTSLHNGLTLVRC